MSGKKINSLSQIERDLPFEQVEHLENGLNLPNFNHKCTRGDRIEIHLATHNFRKYVTYKSLHFIICNFPR